MPKELERDLKQGARKKGFIPGSDRYNRYVYGTMNNMGLGPRRKKTNATIRRS